MNSALIGHTGFVGSNLLRQTPFDHHYNSKNYRDMVGQAYDLVVCCGVSAVKWKANLEPEADWNAISELQQTLANVKVKNFVLISTVDVYPEPAGVDESVDCSGMSNHAYGTHRLRFENFCRSAFSKTTVLRLPGLLGKGLKKNVIFDLIHDNCLDLINPRSIFQYYNLDALWTDISLTLNNQIDLVNLCSEPVSNLELIEAIFPGKQVGSNKGSRQVYDVRSRHADLWGSDTKYTVSKKDIIEQIGRFVSVERRSEK